MRIEKIELTGFKSFAEKTAFNLHPGITCIVGPNGCGKSNVVDAFKWVLGEQSAKSLRGDKMEEVIFGGSNSKKPKGMADVSLSVDGLGGDSKVTTVSRRLYRSGESEYMLNRNICRLRDIKDIFLDTGLEVKSYSILEQDRIAAILNARAEDRRFLIEEVAGVVKYKVRRAEAQSKLESSRLNLQRVNDIVVEVRRQINSLDRQVKKAERYKRLMAELREMELRLARRDYLALKEALESIIASYDALREEDAGLRAGLSSGEAELESLRLRLLEREKRIGELQTALQAKEREIAEAERGIAVLKADMENLKEYLVRLKVEEEEVQRKRAEAVSLAEDASARKAATEAEIEALNAELGTKSESLGVKEGELSEKEAELESKRKESFSLSEEISKHRNELRMHEAFLENLSKKEKSTETEVSETKAESARLTEEISSAASALEALEREAGGIRKEKEDLSADITNGRARLEELKGRLGAEREDLASLGSRLESLRELATGGEPFKEANPLAYVSEILDVPAEYEKAVEAALGEAVTGLVLSDIHEVIRLSNAIRENDAGKTALVPINNLRTPLATDVPSGAVGRASDLVGARGEHSRVAAGLLSGVVVFKDLRSALDYSSGFTSVTLDGEVVLPSGAVIAGKGRGVLKLRRQVRELEAEVEAKKSSVSAVQSQVDGEAESIRQKETALETASGRLAEKEQESVALRQKAQRLADESERLGRKLSYLDVEASETAREKSGLLEAVSKVETSLKDSGERLKIAEEEMTRLQGALAGHKTLYEEQRALTVDIRLALNSCRERAEALNREMEGIERLGEELARKTEFISAEYSSAQGRIEGKAGEIFGNEEALKGLVQEASALASLIGAERDASSGDSEAASMAEHNLKDIRLRIDDLSRRISGLEVGRAEHKLKIENLDANIRNNYDVSIESLEAEPPLQEDEERVEAVRAKIQELGPVSLGTIEEYEELRGRFEFLTGQQADIEQSIAELEEAISKINSTTRKRLKDAYEALNAKFGEIFLSLFGGGRAELRLTDENNILETGIEIIVQPPGKRLQNITLLSGGEKTLTALSLLFASFLIKPTPLCILDEADAALDESNTEKFSKMLRGLAVDTQFIVITHNKVTMEAADYIYGITMEEAGVSKVISLEFAEAATQAGGVAL